MPSDYQADETFVERYMTVLFIILVTMLAVSFIYRDVVPAIHHLLHIQ